MPLVVTTSELRALIDELGAGVTPEAAIDTGMLVRRKVSGQWVHATSHVALDDALDRVRQACNEELTTSFLAPITALTSSIARRIGGGLVSPKIAEIAVRDLVRTGRYEAVGMTSAQYIPYLAIYLPAAAPSVTRAVGVVRERVALSGRVRQDELPAPTNLFPIRDDWRFFILRHAEFLGLGSVRHGELVGWGLL